MKNKLFYSIRQQGVVLFIALVALVVMSLAAVALIRAVDTNTVITGNLSFKQSAVIAADSGIEAAFTWLNNQATNNLASLNGDLILTGEGYFSRIPDLHQAPPYVGLVNLDSAAELRLPATWNNSVTIPDTGDGNTVNYIVQRMCLRADDPSTAPDHCVFGDRPQNQNLNPDCEYQACAEVGSLPSPMYRVTVRVTGPKNTVSYTQAYAY